MKVVREHYLRDDVWCGVKGCTQCKQQDPPPLDAYPDIDSTLYPKPHLILPDTNVVLHQIDFLEDTAVSNVILLSVVLQEVRLITCILHVHVHVYYMYMYMCMCILYISYNTLFMYVYIYSYMNIVILLCMYCTMYIFACLNACSIMFSHL